VLLLVPNAYNGLVIVGAQAVWVGLLSNPSNWLAKFEAAVSYQYDVFVMTP